MRSPALTRCALLGTVLLACDGSDDPGRAVTANASGGSAPSGVEGLDAGAGANGSSPSGGAGDPGVATGGSAEGGAAQAGAAQGGATQGGATQGGAAQGGAAQGGGGAAAGAAGAAGVEGAGAAGAGGAVNVFADVTAVVPSVACGFGTPPEDGTYTIDVSGTKTECARAGCGGLVEGAWSDTREYTIYKPTGYVNTTPYMLVFEGPGCGGTSVDVYPFDGNAGDSIIRIGLRPSQNAEIQESHGTNPSQGCFDDKEGDDSVDFVLYQDLYDLLGNQLCFDRNRVFAAGNSSGAWLTNELGCKYAGDPQRPIRGIIPNTGGLPDQPQFKPTCTNHGMAGMWIREVGDSSSQVDANIYAINRAMMLNGCPAGQTYDTAQFEDFPILGLASNTCRRILSCDPLYPLVVCPLNGNGHGPHDEIVNPAGATFLQSFLAPPLAPQ